MVTGGLVVAPGCRAVWSVETRVDTCVSMYMVIYFCVTSMKHDITIMRAKKKSLSRLVSARLRRLASRPAHAPAVSVRHALRHATATPPPLSLRLTAYRCIDRCCIVAGRLRRWRLPHGPPLLPSSPSSSLLTLSLHSVQWGATRADTVPTPASQASPASASPAPWAIIKGEQPRDIGPLSPASGPSHQHRAPLIPNAVRRSQSHHDVGGVHPPYPCPLAPSARP